MYTASPIADSYKARYIIMYTASPIADSYKAR